MRVSKRQLRRIIKEEKSKLLSEADGDLQTYKVVALITVPPGQEEYIFDSIVAGMEFDEEAGEGIDEYSVEPFRG